MHPDKIHTAMECGESTPSVLSKLASDILRYFSDDLKKADTIVDEMERKQLAQGILRWAVVVGAGGNANGLSVADNKNESRMD